MNQETLEALRKSIDKWSENARAERTEDVLMGVNDCPLCDIFYRHNLSCKYWAVTREIINGREPNAIVTSLPAASKGEYLWLVRMAQRLGAMRRSFALTSETAAAADQMVIMSLNDTIAEIDANARSILDCCTVGMGRDPETMEAEDREEYERLLTLAKRATCAMTMLGIG